MPCSPAPSRYEHWTWRLPCDASCVDEGSEPPIGVGSVASTRGAGSVIVVEGDVMNCTDWICVPRGNVKTLVIRGSRGVPGRLAYDVASATETLAPSVVSVTTGVVDVICSVEACAGEVVSACEAPMLEMSSVRMMKNTLRCFMGKSPLCESR